MGFFIAAKKRITKNEPISIETNCADFNLSKKNQKTSLGRKIISKTLLLTRNYSMNFSTMIEMSYEQKYRIHKTRYFIKASEVSFE